MPESSVARLRELGDSGVTALLADCVRIESPGRTGPESVVTGAIAEILKTAPGRVIVTTFASNVDRVANVIVSAHRLGRAAVLVGRSMERNLSVADELGYIDLPEGSIIRTEDMRNWRPEQLVVITTGSQGEPAAALSRIAAGEHRQIKIMPADTVVMAATPVPGNEASVSRTIDNLFRLGRQRALSRRDAEHPRLGSRGARGTSRAAADRAAPLRGSLPRRVQDDGAVQALG